MRTWPSLRAWNKLTTGLASPDHRADMLRPGFDEVGIGILDGPYGLMCTEVFRTAPWESPDWVGEVGGERTAGPRIRGRPFLEDHLQDDDQAGWPVLSI